MHRLRDKSKNVSLIDFIFVRHIHWGETLDAFDWMLKRPFMNVLADQLGVVFFFIWMGDLIFFFSSLAPGKLEWNLDM